MDDENQILELTEPAFKLFGRPIQLPEAPHGTPRAAGGDGVDDVEERRSCGMDSGLEDESANEGNLGEKEEEHELENGEPEKASRQDAALGTDENLDKTVAQSKMTLRTEGDRSDGTVPQEKSLKKPDKIIPCPRCDSMDTKFCYFNNHNVNQPRYFCRKCQRYWTAGGTLRKLPVGAGRRKSKSSSAHFSHIDVHRDFPGATAPQSNGVNVVHRPVAVNGSVLSFVPDQHAHQISSPIVADKARQTSTTNASSSLLTGAGVVVDDNGSASAGSNSNVENEGEYQARVQTAQNHQGFQPQMLCFPAPLWPPIPWSPAQYNYPLPSRVNCGPGFPMPFYPTPLYMGCAVSGAWNMPWSAQSPSPSPNPQPDPKSPTLGKHSRGGNVAKLSSEEEDEQKKVSSPKPSIWVPKTLRIDELEEAAKSSIWETLGIKNDTTAKDGGKGHFKPFSSQIDETCHPVTASAAILANPAALSRSLNFHENT